jgi:transcriptional regulator of heat shock response
MVRVVDYDSRRKAVLAGSINRYIEKAEPVSSQEIARKFGLSSATVRNIFSELENMGYLTHLYTSGGRIPTAKGYRYYVDCLLHQMELLDEEKEIIVKNYKRQIRRLEDALEETSGVISAITHYTGIVSFLEWEDRFFYGGISRILEQPEFRDTEKIRLLIKLIEEKQRLLKVINQDFQEKVKVYIGDELGCSEMDGCSLVVSSYNFRNRPSGRIAVLGPARMEYSHIIPAIEYISEALSEALEEI